MPQLSESNVHGHGEGHEDYVVSTGGAGPEWDGWRPSTLPIAEQRARWEALAVEPQHLLPVKALVACIRDLARELLHRTAGSGSSGDEHREGSSSEVVVLVIHLRNGRTLRIPVTHWKYTRSRDGKIIALSWETPANRDPLLLYVDVDEITALTEEPGDTDGPDIVTAAGERQ